MDIRRESALPKVKDFQIVSSWIPATPEKPILTKPQPICADRQENQPCQANWSDSERFWQGNQLGQANWLESERFSTKFLQETQAHGVVACSSLTNPVDVNGGFDNREAALATKTRVYDDNMGIYNQFSMDSIDGCNNMAFADLLALADAADAATATAASAIATAQTNVNVTSSFIPFFDSQIEGNRFETSSANSSLANQDLSAGSRFQINSNCTHDIPQYGCSIPSRPFFDLNSPLRTVTDAVSSKDIPQFAPITPDQAKRVEKKQVSDIPNVSTDERTDQARDKQENKIATERVEVNELHHGTELSCADFSTQLQENHNPDKGDDQGIDLNPQQKPRRKKHRPKVVIEGKPKRTRKPATPKPAGPKETPTGKRKYVRKNGLNKSTTTASAEVISQSTEAKTIGHAKKSCRRSLNFDFKSQVRDENYSCRPPSNFNSESQAQNFYTKAQSRSNVQLGQGMEVIVEKTQLGVAYDLAHSMNQILEGYLSMPGRQAPSPSTPTKTDPPHDNLMADAQDECKRGKCRIVFSDETHDKEASSVEVMINSNAQSAPSPNDSNCSSSTCLTKGKQAMGLKRGHSCTIDEAELCSKNAIGPHYNSLQAYQAMFPGNEHNGRILGMHFPEICKRKRTEKGHNSATSSTLSTVTATENSASQSTTYNLNDARTNPFTSETNCRISTSQFNASGASTKIAAIRSAQDMQHTFKHMLALGHTERLTKKRSKGPTRVRDLASLSPVGIVELKSLPTSARGATSSDMQGFGTSHHPHTCMEALVQDTRARMATKKRTKRNSLASSLPPNIYDHHQSLTKSIGPLPGTIRKGMFYIDAIAEQLKSLDINSESKQVTNQEQNALILYNMRYQQQNALVPYRRDGTVVPFGGSFDMVKKRRARPKVDLDDETNRVWKLLLENINSEGIDGTDKEKAKWWEEERRVFCGRADSFIARMHLVQGDRRFSQWKGSVVDSVVGVFLTQNVSDHLSSSAYMSLAARFALKSKDSHSQCSEERTSILVKEPEVCVLDPEDIIRWHEEKSNQPACDQSSVTLQEVEYNEEKEAVNSNESIGSSTVGVRSTESLKCKLLDSSKSALHVLHQSAVDRSATEITETGASFMGHRREIDEVLSSQNSVVSSQNSVDSSIAQTAEQVGSYARNNTEAELAAMSKSNSSVGFTSFVKLLQMAGTTTLPEIYNNVSENATSNEKGHNQSEGMACDSQEPNNDKSYGPKSKLGPEIPSNRYCLHLTPNSGDLEVECFEMLGVKSRFSDIFKKNEENCSSEQSELSAESASQATVQRIATVRSQEATKSSSENNRPCHNMQVEVNKIFHSRRTVEDPKNNGESQTLENNCKMQQVLDVPNFSGETLDFTESTTAIDNSRKTEYKEVESNLNDKGHLLGKTGNEVNANTSRAKRGRIVKEKQNAVDWDSLRKQAQANGKKRERTANTMDSMDWEAVRCADVNVIADTIKERGMNNMLAERIKDFLNRLVRDHGSIDLEWLRDVPPDKAKEYLLSIRGLGLKSVECVRLLTLHHLAFPVDTNVGRIAVRLGWVPLQPLPESLQLHLLELYPVLESIQKYLWPRLCKLDQRTLYELHYQMITFGKVFCTKSKPNCNACPMRGECRHFASAFASARLALPAPEEESIMSAIENKAADPKTMGIINPLQLHLSQANQQPEAQTEFSNCEPIIEVPATPEPIIEVPATPEPEWTQIPESDIEDAFFEDPDEIPTINLNIEEFTQNLQNYMQQNMELQEGDMSKALVALTPEAASIPMPKLKNVSRLRTEHQVYELPDSHPLLEGLDKREPDDPCSYLLAIWTPGETANSIQPPDGSCSSQESGKLCGEKTCFSCNSILEANSQTVRGTLLIPCRTAMRGSFPLNGTYFQVNEVFADHESSLNPIDVPRAWIWNLPRRTVYFGTSIPTIFKGLSTEGIQYCFWRGFVCVRGFDQKTRAPRPLMARLHFPASKLTRTKGKTVEN